MSTTWSVFAGIAPGLEQALHDELTGLLPDVRLSITGGGVTGRVSSAELWSVATRCRLAGSLRVTIGRFGAQDFRTLEERLGRLPWRAYLPPGGRPKVRVTAHKSRLNHTGAIGERIEAAIVGALGGGGGGGGGDAQKSAGAPGQGADVFARSYKDKFTIRVDGGGRMSTRGYRIHPGPGPLAENVCAALVQLSGWTPDRPLFDPFCSSGIIVAEAALLATHPVIKRDLPILTWPTWNAAGDTDSRITSKNSIDAPIALQITGSDSDHAVLGEARTNLDAAGLGALIDVRAANADKAIAEAPEGAFMVSNLPYGRRLDSKVLAKTLARMGAALKARPDIKVTVLNGWRGFAKDTGVEWESLVRTTNRGASVEVLTR